jgi:hypothetical protein
MPNRVQVRYPVNTLVSYHYFKKQDISAFTRHGYRCIGDSGAFSAMTTGKPIDINDFGMWAKKWQKDLAWVASLDVIGNQTETWNNYQRLREYYGVDVVPTLHYGADPSEMDKYVEQGVDYIGLGGMVPFKSEPQKLLRWTLSMFKYARDNHPQVRFHGWGITHKDLLTTLPWYSVDSTGWAYSFMLGRHTLWIPTEGKFVRFATDGKEAFKYGDQIREHYGIEPADIAFSNNTNYQVTVRTSARSYQLLEDHMRKRFNISAPKYGVAKNAPVGPNIHLANGSSVVFTKYLVPITEGETNG